MRVASSSPSQVATLQHHVHEACFNLEDTYTWQLTLFFSPSQIAMLQGRNWTPAWPKRFRLRLKSELTPEELADRAAKAAFAANGYK